MSKKEIKKKLRQGVQGTGGKVGENEGNESSGNGVGDIRGNAWRMGTQGESEHMDLGYGEQRPETALTLATENEELRRQLKERDKDIKRLNELNEFLEEASSFFAASRRKSGKPTVKRANQPTC